LFKAYVVLTKFNRKIAYVINGCFTWLRCTGKCGNDGFYYKDHYSFVICSNGNSYVQPCAPGSRNSHYGRYSYGHSYYYRDFCDVNLVDYGYGAHRPAYHRPAYGYGGYGHGHGHFAGFAPFYGRYH